MRAKHAFAFRGYVIILSFIEKSQTAVVHTLFPKLVVFDIETCD